MSKINKTIFETDCVGDSLSKHNYNVLAFDQNICNLSSTFFNMDDNYHSIFSDLCSNINSFNNFADIFYEPSKISNASTATTYLTGYWQKREVNLTFPVNIYELDGEIKYYIDESTPNSTIQNYGISQLRKFYPPQNMVLNTVANVYFLLYSNQGGLKVQTSDSKTFASDSSPIITTFLNSGTYQVPAGITKLDVLVVGGGGGGAGHGQRSGGGGGGGGGVVYSQNISVTPNQSINVIVGNGGLGGGSGFQNGERGQSSAFGSIFAEGGFGGRTSVGGDLQGGATGGGLNITGIGGNGQYSTISSATNGGNGYFFQLINRHYGGGGGGGNDYKGIALGGLGGGGKGGHSSYANDIPAYYAEYGFDNTGGGGGGAARNQGGGSDGGSGIVLVIRNQQSSALQTNKYFNVVNRKDDVFIKRIKIAKYYIDPITNNWTFLRFVS